MRFYSKAVPSPVNTLDDALKEETERCAIPLHELELYFPDIESSDLCKGIARNPYGDEKSRVFFRGDSMIPDLVLSPSEILIEPGSQDNGKPFGEPNWKEVKEYPTPKGVFIFDNETASIKMTSRDLEGLSPVPTKRAVLSNLLFRYLEWFAKEQGTLQFTSSDYGFLPVREILKPFDESTWSHADAIDKINHQYKLTELWDAFGPFRQGFKPVMKWLAESSAITPRILHCDVSMGNIYISLGMDSRIAAYYALLSGRKEESLHTLLEKRY